MLYWEIPKNEFSQFLSIAQGSLSELDTQLELCVNYLGLIKLHGNSNITGKLNEVGRLISGLKRSL